MNRIILVVFAICSLTACNNSTKQETSDNMTTQSDTIHFTNGYSDVNGIKMYYEIYGEGKPLVLIHGGGSTIQTSFGRIIPLLAKNRQIIAVELQAHGHTSDRDTPLSFEQDADDVATLLKNLNIQKADVLGFSNGGNSALQLAIRHPQLCKKIIACSVLLKKDGTKPEFWEFMKNASFEHMPKAYKDAFLEIHQDSTKLLAMHDKCAQRMVNFKEFSDDEIRSISAPVLLVNGDQDVALNEHIVAMSKLIQNCRIAIPPSGHGEYLGEITTLKPTSKDSDFIAPMIEYFLDN